MIDLQAVEHQFPLYLCVYILCVRASERRISSLVTIVHILVFEVVRFVCISKYSLLVANVAASLRPSGRQMALLCYNSYFCFILSTEPICRPCGEYSESVGVIASLENAVL